MSDLPDVIASVAGALGQAHVEALAEAYRSAGADPDKVRQSVPAPHRHEVDRLNQAWAGHPEVTGGSTRLTSGSRW